jgi:hypothetical protein
MPKDFIISEVDDKTLASFLTEQGIIRGGETGFVATEGFVVSYIGKAKNPDVDPVLDKDGNDTRPYLPGVAILVGVQDTAPRKAQVEAVLETKKIVTTRPIRIWAGNGEKPYWELTAEEKKL